MQISMSMDTSQCFTFHLARQFALWPTRLTALTTNGRDFTEDVEGIRGLVSDGNVLGLELPPTVELDIAACDPSMRGASATARTKPATLSTGLVVQVPEYLAPGERVRVDTASGKFLGRA